MPNWPRKSPVRAAVGVALGRLADGGQEAMDFGLGQADAVVGHLEGGRFARRCRDREGDFTRVAAFHLLPRRDCVHRVLQKLADEHLRPAVQVVRQDVDNATEVDLKTMLQGSLPCPLRPAPIARWMARKAGQGVTR